MVELNTSHFFNFQLVSRFFRDMNKSSAFSLDGMNGVSDSDEYQLIVYESIPADIGSCTNDDGQLLIKSKYPADLKLLENNVFSATIHLLCQDTENNNGFTISVAEDNGISIALSNGENGYHKIQGLFLINSDTRYLLAYARLSDPIEIKDNLILPFTGALCKVGNCR